MNFLKNIINRHTNATNIVKPRLKGVYEQENNRKESLKEDISEIEGDDYLSSLQNTSTSEDKNGNTTSGLNIEPPFSNQHSALNQHFEKISNRNFVSPSNTCQANLLEVEQSAAKKEQRSSDANISSSQKEPEKIVLSNDAGSNTLKKEGVSFTVEPIVSNTNTPLNIRDGAITDFVNPLSAEFSQTKQSLQILSWSRNIKNILNYDVNEKSEVSPIVKVNIGRIDVRAISQQTPVKTKEEPKSTMSLDEFLKKKNGTV